MQNVMLRLFFHGLIAFVPNEDVKLDPESMTAHIIEHTGHSMFLHFEMKGSTTCPASGLGQSSCSSDTIHDGSQWCTCEIKERVSMKFDPEPQRESRKFGGKPPSTPANAAAAEDLRWLVRMAHIDKDAGNFKLDQNKIQASLSFGLRASPQSALVCHLDQVANAECFPRPKPGCMAEIFPFVFVGTSGVHTQSLAEYVMFDQRFSSMTPTLTVTNRQDASKKITITLDCRVGGCPDLLVANGVRTMGCSGAACEVGQHFAAYYDFVDGSPWPQIPVRLRFERLLNRDRQLHRCTNDPLTRRGEFLATPQSAKVRQEKVASASSVIGAFNEFVITAVDTPVICPTAMFDQP